MDGIISKVSKIVKTFLPKNFQFSCCLNFILICNIHSKPAELYMKEAVPRNRFRLTVIRSIIRPKWMFFTGYSKSIQFFSSLMNSTPIPCAGEELSRWFTAISIELYLEWTVFLLRFLSHTNGIPFLSDKYWFNMEFQDRFVFEFELTMLFAKKTVNKCP